MSATATARRGRKGKIVAENASDETQAAAPQLVQAIDMLPLASIQPSPRNRQAADDDPSLDSLADSIARDGLLSPIWVMPHPEDADGYEIIFGERRFRACRRLGHLFIPAVVRNIDARQAQALRLIENRERRDLTPMEEGEGVAVLMKLYKDHVPEVAARLGKSENWVRRRARLPNLSDKWRAALAGEKAEYAHIRDSLERMEEIAILPREEQDAILESGQLRWTKTTADMRQFLAKWFRRLDARPWPDNFDKVMPAKDRCGKCARRSDRDGDLFAHLSEEGEDSAAAFCLDSACWRNKGLAWVKQLLDASPGAVALAERTNHDEFERLRADLDGYRLVDRFNWSELEEGEKPGDVQGEEFLTGVICNGDRLGQIVEALVDVEPDPADEAAEEERERKSEERWKEEERKRKVKEAKVKAFKASLAKLLPKDCPFGDATKLLALGVHFGLDSARSEKMTIGDLDAEAVARAAWECLCRRILDRAGNTYWPMTDKDRKNLCEYLELDWDAINKGLKKAGAKEK